MFVAIVFLFLYLCHNMDEAKLDEILDRKLAGVNEQLLMMNHRLQETINSLHFLSESYDAVVSKLNRLEESKKLADLEISSLKNEVAELRCLAIQNKHDINELEQYSRRDCLEIRGVPLPDLESTDAAVVKMAECIDVEIEENDMSTSHRLPTRKKTSSQSKRPEQPPAIIVKFISRDKRDELYRARSKLKNLTSADLGYRGTANKLFISESLTRYNKELFGKCLEARRRLGYKFIWTQQGRIYLRKEYNDPVIHVASMSDIDTKL